MATKTEKRSHADVLETALQAYEAAEPEERISFERDGVADRAHAAVRHGLKLVGNDPHDPEVLYSRGFVNSEDPESWNKAVRVLIEELRA